ncbi:exopolysaccharide biosynthesis protein [Lacibacterium aquatile]|uniref:Exopolysaccharide biosynthesis protein n=1 Tax=Lacibacterium aquatile TaxID=1168082 RepID=A0ABW5DQW4_9PROT
MSPEPENAAQILDKLTGLADQEEQITLNDVIEAFGNRSYGPMLLIPACIELTPIGSIPGVPTVIALLIIFTALQMALGRKHLWLPGFLLERSVTAETLRKAVDKMRRPAKWADRWFHGRLKQLTKGRYLRIAAVACILMACTVPPLELLPLATTIPMAAIAVFALGVTLRDGVIVLAAILLAIGLTILGVSLVTG